ncbi:endonuclease/exonuclease/phosphatase family protein [Aliisedimentitalea scapharcae]|uniref:Endonuclease/exonuclease/phosphatase family protein n=1 Tax=Aliisedimentitalea scapharcae TaxID=1524259 RepID=A0ABZ2XR33_9RHOB
MRRLLAGAALLLLGSLACSADPLRLATFNTELSRKGPGLLLRAIQRGDDPAVRAVIQVIARNNPDILVLQGVDWDHENRAVRALVKQLAKIGVDYPHMFSAQPNAGLATNLDLNGDGRLGGPEDAQGFGAFTGQSGMAILSRHPIKTAQIVDYSATLWLDLPGAIPPTHPDGNPFPSAEAMERQRLPSVAIWAVPVTRADGSDLTVLAFQAGPPVFDGPEDRNGRRNHDELQLLRQIVRREFGPALTGDIVLAGGANLDPCDSDGRTQAIVDLLAETRLQDPAPRSSGAAAATAAPSACSDPALDTVDWPGIGKFRVDYILPSVGMRVVNTGVFWPTPDQADGQLAQQASRHRLVWVDLAAD